MVSRGGSFVARGRALGPLASVPSCRGTWTCARCHVHVSASVASALRTAALTVGSRAAAIRDTVITT